jgi:uncharacterized membrane protein
MAFHEKHSRSIAKAFTYRLLIIIADSVIVFLLTRRWDLVAGFVIISNIYSTVLYFIHERIWNDIHWGKVHIKPK